MNVACFWGSNKLEMKAPNFLGPNAIFKMLLLVPAITGELPSGPLSQISS